MEYNHMSFGGPPVKTETAEEADELLQLDEKASEIGTTQITSTTKFFKLI